MTLLFTLEGKVHLSYWESKLWVGVVWWHELLHHRELLLYVCCWQDVQNMSKINDFAEINLWIYFLSWRYVSQVCQDVRSPSMMINIKCIFLVQVFLDVAGYCQVKSVTFNLHESCRLFCKLLLTSSSELQKVKWRLLMVDVHIWNKSCALQMQPILFKRHNCYLFTCLADFPNSTLKLNVQGRHVFH